MSRPGGPSWQDEPFRHLVDGVGDYGIFLLDAQGRVQSWNRGARMIAGYEPAEIIGKSIEVLYPPAALDRRWPQHELETARRLGRFEDEGWRLRKDGGRFWANVVTTAMRDADGQLLGFSAVVRDLTERRNNEERLRLSEERFRVLVDSVRDYAIFMLDPGGHVASWNDGAQRMKGYAASEIIGKHFSVFYPAEALARDWPAHELKLALEAGRFEDEGWRIRKDGTRFWANVIITTLRDREGVHIGFSKITRDLTERRRQEERLRESEERFRLLLEGVEDYAICMLDPEGRVSSWNAAAERITGYSAAQIIGQSFERFYPADDIAAGRAAADLRTAALSRRSDDRGWRLRKDGTRFWAEVVMTALHDPDGRLRGFAQVTRDLSERKRMEALEEHGRHLTEFLAMLAHELRNPLAPIRNAIGIMALAGDASPQMNWCREVIERQTTHLTHLVDDLLDVSRVTRGKLRLKTAHIDLREAVASGLEATRPLVEARRHQLQLSEPREPVWVHGDMTRLAQVVMNLVTNAAKYTPEAGRIWVDVDVEEGGARVRVRDTGMGIAPQMLERVFDLFAQGERTLERAEGGLGIGLTLARRIVALHGGSIAARSEGPGKGSQFEVRLPLAPSGTAGLAQAQEGAPGPAARRRNILVVDDNADAANSVAMLLRMAGHEVRVEHEGEAAIERAAQHPPEIVLLDLGLPSMSGYEAAERMRANAGGAPMHFLAMTGYGQDEDKRRSEQAGFAGHLVKPVVPNELVALIDRLA